MRGFRVEGDFRMGRERSDFTLELACANVLEAKHRTLSILGSRHRVRRAEIRILNITEVAPDAIADPAVLHAIRVHESGKIPKGAR